MKQSIMSIYYNDNDNTFTDEFGQVEYDISDLMPIDEVLRYKKNGGTYYSRVQEYNGEIFEIEFPIKETDRIIYYDLPENVMIDEEGDVIFNLFSIIRPNDLLIFKQRKENMIVKGLNGGAIEMVYPNCY